jgi:hypothetical protein
MKEKRNCTKCIHYGKKYFQEFGKKGKFEEFCNLYKENIQWYQAEVCDDFTIKNTKK